MTIRASALRSGVFRFNTWALLCVPAAALLMAASTGEWLTAVPAADHATADPVAGHADAIAAGSALYQDNCAKC
jgi:mono/diheme cytochrome c family protein